MVPAYNKKYSNTIFYHKLDGPLGDMLAVFSEREIYLLEFLNTPSLAKRLDKLQKVQEVNFVFRIKPLFHKLVKELEEYFLKKRQYFTLPLRVEGSPFELSVWQILAKIPYGKVISYKEQALIIKRPKAVRAVAQANSRNNLPILIPCHRVIGSNGKLVGFASGCAVKKYLLNLEGASF